MSLARKMKLNKKDEKGHRQEARIKEAFQRCAQAIGVRLEIDRLPKAARDFLLRGRFPCPTVTVDAGIVDLERAVAIRDAVTTAIHQTRLVAPDGVVVSALDFFQYCLALRESLYIVEKHNWGGPIALQVKEARRRSRSVCDGIVAEPLHQLLVNIDMALSRFTRIDTALYWFEPRYCRVEKGKGLLSVTIRKTDAEKIKVKMDGEVRPAFRCGASHGANGLHWVSLPARLFGDKSDKKYPVYVQSHAIRNLHERVPLKGGEGVVHDFLWQSLSSPEMLVRDNGDRLIEYRFYQHKLGYLPVEVIDDKVLVKSFWFLTMQNTPEADCLYKLKRLTRPDIEELSLDSLATFVLTDVQSDPELRDLLERCGCGHLLNMATPEAQKALLKGEARRIKDYLGMNLSVRGHPNR